MEKIFKEESIYSYIKKRIDPRDFVRQFLGEPAKIIGEHHYWPSPFYQGDNDPSFCANGEQITDFSSSSDFGAGQDIFNFIVKYNELTHYISPYSISYYDALKWVNNRYELGIDLPNTDFSKQVKGKANTKSIYTLKKVDKSTAVDSYGIVAYFDEAKYNTKPNSAEIGKIKNRIEKENIRSWTIQNLKEMILNGQTCIPSGIKSKKDWVDNENYYQIFMVDFDNAGTETVIDETTGKKKNTKINYTVGTDKHISIDEILKYCNEINLLPTFIYTTFSHTVEQNKFRLVYVLDQPIKELKAIEGIYQTLKNTFANYHIDNAATDIARMFFGGREIVYESDNYYKIVEEEVLVEELNETNMTKIHYSEIEKKFNNYLKNTIYEARNNHLGYITKNDTFVSISNFVPFCINKINYINGNDTITKYEMKCVLLDNPQIQLSTLIVDAITYAKCDFILGSTWDKHCIVSAGNGNSQRLREIMQLISRETMTEKNVYTHTGFRKVEDKLCYLYHRRSNRQCCKY